MPLSGYVKLHRSLLEWTWHDEPETLSVWIHLLLLASFKQTDWHGIPLQPGQVITSRDSLAKMTGLTDRKVRTALTRLKSTGSLTIKSTNRYTLISLVNFEFFQGQHDGSDQHIDHQSDKPATNERPHRENVKKEKNIEEPRKRFIPPTVEDVRDFCRKEGLAIDAEYFCNYYTSKGWRVGSQPMRDWQAAARNWARRECKKQAGGTEGRITLEEL